MGILSKTIDTVKDVGQGILTTVLDPHGSTRGSIAAQKLVDEGQGYINKLEARIAASTKFWADHQKMLGDNYTSYEWKEALLAREAEQEKAKLKDTGKILPPNYVQQLKDSGAANDLYELYEEKMNKAKKYKLAGGMEYNDANIKTHIKNHSQASRNVINRAARQIFNSYGWDKDLFNALGFGRDRTAVNQEIGDYSFLLQAEDGPIKQRFIEHLTQELHSGKGRFNDIDAKELTAMFENMTIDYKPIIKDAMTSSEMLKNSRAEDMVNYMINIESGNLDASLFPKLDESENFVFEGVGGLGLTGFFNVTMTPQEMLDQLWVQRHNNEKEEGGNSFLNFVSDFKQMSSLLTNVATDKEFGINATDTQIELNMTAYNLIKNNIKPKDKDLFSGETGEPFYLDYEKLTVEEKLAFISTIGDTLIEAGGNKTAIKENLPLIKERMKEALAVTDKAIIRALEFSIGQRPFTNQGDVNDYKNEIARLYKLSPDNTSYINSLIDDKFKAQASSPLEEQMQNTFDPLSTYLNPTSNLNQDIYTQTVSESIKDEMLKETPVQEDIDSEDFNNITQEVGLIPEEEGDTLLEGFLKKDFSEVPNFSMKNPKHKAAFNAGEIVFVLPSLIGNDILTANQYLDASEDVKKAGKFLKRKAKSLLSKAGDVFENVRDPYMIMEDTSLEFKKEDKIENTIDIIDKLKDELRYLEGDRKNKGKPVLKAYKLKGEDYYTIGFGHYGPDVTEDMEITVEKAEELLEEDILERIPQIQADFKDFEKFKNYLKIPMFIEYYRGSLTASGSPETTRLINEGKYEEAAIEFLDNEEYINAEKLNRRGIRKRMQAVVRALKYYSLNK